MRVRLKRGYQKKLILLTKTKKNLTWKKLSKEIGLSEGYLKNELKGEKTTLDEEIYKKLCGLAEVNLKGYIIKKLNELGTSI